MRSLNQQQRPPPTCAWGEGRCTRSQHHVGFGQVIPEGICTNVASVSLSSSY